MLIVTRRSGETLWVGEGVEIRVLETTPSRVKLGIVAPRSLAILRGEVKAAEEQNLAAALVLEESLPQVLRYLRSQTGPVSHDKGE